MQSSLLSFAPPSLSSTSASTRGAPDGSDPSSGRSRSADTLQVAGDLKVPGQHQQTASALV